MGEKIDGEEDRKCNCCGISDRETFLVNKPFDMDFYGRKYDRYSIDPKKDKLYCEDICSPEKDMERHYNDIEGELNKVGKEYSLLDNKDILEISLTRAREIAEYIRNPIYEKGHDELHKLINPKKADYLVSRLEGLLSDS